MSWPVPGGSLSVKLTYSSGRLRRGALGIGWSHTYERRVEDMGDAGIVEIDGRGVELFFAASSSGGYLPSKRGGATATRTTTGWTIRYANGREYRYLADGRLTEIAEGCCNATRLEYGVDGTLARVIDPAGNALTFEMSGGLLGAIRAKDGQRILFGYTGDRLMFLQEPLGATTTYAYSTDTGDLNHVGYATGDTVDYVYSNGQVVTTIATEPSGAAHRTLIEYPDGLTRRLTDPSLRTTTYVFNEHGQLMSRVDPNGSTYILTRDSEGRLTALDAPGHLRGEWTYEQGRIASYRSPQGKVTRVVRDPATGFPTILIRPDQQNQMTRTFDAHGRVLTERDELGHEVHYERDDRGLVTLRTDALGHTTQYVYDLDGSLITAVDPAGGVTTYTHDTLGRVTEVRSPGGKVSRTEYTGLTLVAATVDPAGNRIENQYDAASRLVRTTRVGDGATTTTTYTTRGGNSLADTVTDPLGGVSSMIYDDFGRAIASTDAQGRTTRFTLDALGRVSRVDYPTGAFQITRYDAAGRVSETENERGAKTRYGFNADGQLTETENAEGAISRQDFDDDGRVRSRTAADGGTEYLFYDPTGRPVLVINALGFMTKTLYSPTGTVTATVNENGRTTSFTQDDLDRTVCTVDPLQFITKNEYSADSEVIKSTNRRGNATRFEFDAAGRLVRTIDALSGAAKRCTDVLGRLTSVEDELGHAWRFSYDLLDRKIQETDPDGRTTTLEYYPAGALKRVHFADGSEWRYERDAGDHVTRRTLLRGSAVEDAELFRYNTQGSRIFAENAAVRVESEFDLLERETHRTTTWKKTGAVRELRWSYDTMGRRQRMADSHGRLMTYSYDKLARPTAITVLEPNPLSTSVADSFLARTYSFTWDPAGNLTQIDYPNRTRTRRFYDAGDRLTRLVHERVTGPTTTETLASWDLVRDENGNPTRVVRENGETWTFSHDPLDRLVAAHLPKELVARLRAQDPAKGSASGDRDKDKDDPRDQDECIEKLIRGSGAGDITYKYDAAGNRLEESLGGRVIASTFSPANEMLTRGTMRYSYDPRGNQTEKVYASGRREVFGYNAAAKLASFSTGRVGDAKLKEVQRYLYEPDGGRVLVEDVQGGQLQHALWDGARPIEEFVTKTDGRATKDKGTLYTRGLGGDLLDQARYTRRTSKTLHGLEDEDCDDWDDRGECKRGGPEFQLGHVRFVHLDFLGSTSLVTNHHGKVLDRLTYGPWGENFEGDRNKTAFGYTGHRWDASTGHWMAQHRYLDPRAGRWTQADPAGDVDGPNRYLYTLDRPLSETDPTGLLVTITPSGVYEKALVGIPVYETLNKSSCFNVNVTVYNQAFVPVGNEEPGAANVKPYREAFGLLQKGERSIDYGYTKLLSRGPKPGAQGPLFSGSNTSIFKGSQAIWTLVSPKYVVDIRPKYPELADLSARQLAARRAFAQSGQEFRATVGTIVHELTHSLLYAEHPELDANVIEHERQAMTKQLQYWGW